MCKQEFLAQLRKGLEQALPQKELEERLTFYSEMIDDRMEEGLSEEEAVAAVGSVDEILTQAAEECPPAKAEKVQPRRPKAWEIVLLVVGSPLWLALGIAAFAAVFSLYIAAWAVIIALWSVFAVFAGCALGCVVGGVVLACTGNLLPGIALIGAGLVCAGLSVFAFYGCKAATKGLVLLAKKCFSRKRFQKKEEL